MKTVMHVEFYEVAPPSCPCASARSTLARIVACARRPVRRGLGLRVWLSTEPYRDIDFDARIDAALALIQTAKQHKLPVWRAKGKLFAIHVTRGAPTKQDLRRARRARRDLVRRLCMLGYRVVMVNDQGGCEEYQRRGQRADHGHNRAVRRRWPLSVNPEYAW